MMNKKLEKYKKIIAEQDELLVKQNAMIVRLNEEVKQACKMIEFYEKCISSGVKIEIHDIKEKGGNADKTGDVKFGNF